ncbi:MAG: NUDIX hydrolase [Verrucomicrobia bacterium]|nr:NUDIX hydrolase [Verrucomicrobiota bacterium]MBI3867579.1 NUDIX hydrolase [Verrucomicrobiota bacterium]
MIQPWRSKHRKQVGDFRIFTIDNESKTSPRTGRDHDFYIINTRNWVNIIAVTPQDELVMVEQFRHGTNTVELEIPGGVIDHDGESPLTTAERELREETGYAGGPPRMLAEIFPNPAIMNNRAHTVLIENCELKHATEFDESEDLITRLIPVKDVPRLVRDGVIRHGIVLVGLYYYDLHLRR